MWSIKVSNSKMQNLLARKVVLSGSQWIDSLVPSGESLNILFSALFLTALQVLIIGNLLVIDFLVLKTTLSVFMACTCLILIFYWFSVIFRNAITGLLSTFFCMLLITKVDGYYSIPFFYMLALAGLANVLMVFRIDIVKIKNIFLMSTIAAIVILGHPDQSVAFDILQRANGGLVFNDTLYHASLAAMIKNYNVVSTGLNGLIETPYHIFSHILFACVSKISGAGVLEVYGMAPQLLFIPILIFAITYVAFLIGKKPVDALPSIWITVSVLLFFLPILFGRWNFWNSYFVSESYLISLPLFLFGLILLLKRDLNRTDAILATVSSALIAASKGPVGLMFVGLWLLRALFFRTRKNMEIIIFISVTVVTATVIFDSAMSNAPTEFVFLHFITHYSYHGSDLLNVLGSLTGKGSITLTPWLWAVVAAVTFFIFHFLFPISVVVAFVRRGGGISLFTNPVALYSLGALLAGMLIISLIKIAGGSAYYFTSVAFFVSLPYCVISLLNFYEKQNRILSVKRFDYLLFYLLFSIVVAVSFKTFRESISAHSRISQQKSDLVESLLKLREAPINHLYKKSAHQPMNNPFRDCVAQPFIYPAVSERPWMNVVDTEHGCFYEFYGFPQYGITAQHQKISVPVKLNPRMRIIDWP